MGFKNIIEKEKNYITTIQNYVRKLDIDFGTFITL